MYFAIARSAVMNKQVSSKSFLRFSIKSIILVLNETSISGRLGYDLPAADLTSSLETAVLWLLT